jgi:hypothetical protein
MMNAETQTINAEPLSSSAKFLHITPDAGCDDARADMAAKAVKFVVESGCKPEDAAKIANIFSGTRAICAPMTPHILIASVNALCLEQEILLNTIGGSLDIRLDGSDRHPTTIGVRPVTVEDPQQIFLVAVQKLGDTPTGGGPATKFWSYAAVIPQTDKDFPLVLAMNALNDGQRIRLVWSSAIYVRRQTNSVTGETRNVSRLDSLRGLSNMEGVLLHCAKEASFPISETRVNANPPGNRSQNQPNRQPVGAAAPTAGNGGFQDVDGDPWSG